MDEKLVCGECHAELALDACDNVQEAMILAHNRGWAFEDYGHGKVLVCSACRVTHKIHPIFAGFANTMRG
jgi:hypothetical protein